MVASAESRIECSEGWTCIGIAWQMFYQVVFGILCRLEREFKVFFFWGGEGREWCCMLNWYNNLSNAGFVSTVNR